MFSPSPCQKSCHQSFWQKFAPQFIALQFSPFPLRLYACRLTLCSQRPFQRFFSNVFAPAQPLLSRSSEFWYRLPASLCNRARRSFLAAVLWECPAFCLAFLPWYLPSQKLAQKVVHAIDLSWLLILNVCALLQMVRTLNERRLPNHGICYLGELPLLPWRCLGMILFVS